MTPNHASSLASDAGEALTGAPMGWVLSREKLKPQGADAAEKSGRPHGAHCYSEVHAGPARSETVHAGSHSIWEPGRPGIACWDLPGRVCNPAPPPG
jgi:hypothetical protein